jgi:hypothetical protein
MKTFIGLGLVALPFICIFVFIFAALGMAGTLAVAGIAAGICGSIALGIHLIEGAS